MILETYLKNNDINLKKFHVLSGIPKTTIRAINKRKLEKWNIEIFDVIARVIGKDKFTVLEELESLNSELSLKKEQQLGKYNLENRRYIGNKNKLLNWISELLDEHTQGDSFFDVFGGTGVVTQKVLSKYKKFIINDFLFSNNFIYKGFFGSTNFEKNKLLRYQEEFQKLVDNKLDDDYLKNNYGGKFFSYHDATIIGEIRTRIEKSEDLNEKEKSILIASLIYSADKIANTVGHYDAYRKNVELKNKFKFELINTIDTFDKELEIYREDANNLVKQISADIAFIDPPYNSRQYSRFYHLLEVIAKWEKPELSGVAMKPPVENMSEYSKTSAPKVFDDLIKNLNVKYIVVTYNNTYNSKSSSSKNKISHEEILKSLNSVGITKVFEKPFQFFNSGKTNLKNHKEFVFITEVKRKEKQLKTISKKNSVRSPLFYVGDKYKLMPQLSSIFPRKIATYYDVFCGGGSASINITAQKYVLNDIDEKVVQLHVFLQKNSRNIESLIKKMHYLIKYYGLSLSEVERNEEIEKLKKEFKKTYFAKYNKESYLKLRQDYNKNIENIELLYLLLIYGFNHMIRFNKKGEFNLPVGNVDWNKNVTQSLKNYAKWFNNNDVIIGENMDFEKFVNSQNIKKGDFLYFDPPYLISFSEYNKLWDKDSEKRLYNLLDELDKKGIFWGLSNMISHKGMHNEILLKWSNKYKKYEIQSNYISRYDNSIKKDSKEIYVTNYKGEYGDGY